MFFGDLKTGRERVAEIRVPVIRAIYVRPVFRSETSQKLLTSVYFEARDGPPTPPPPPPDFYT